jgi:hypothetical protein
MSHSNALHTLNLGAVAGLDRIHISIVVRARKLIGASTIITYDAADSEPQTMAGNMKYFPHRSYKKQIQP